MAGHLKSKRVAVLGGGIAGLAVATACAQRGAAVCLFEQAPDLRETGAGLQITPNGARPLEALGLKEALDAGSVRAQAVVPMDAVSGNQVARFDLAGYQAPPYRFFHRARLLGILAQAARDAGVTIRLAAPARATVEGVVTVQGEADCRYDLVIGAEGLHSASRAVLNHTPEPFFTGQVAWRALIPAPEAEPVARIWMAPGRHMVTYPLPDGVLNVVAIQERSRWADEGWHHDDDPAHLRAAFAGLSGRVSGVLARVESVGLWGLFRHPVAACWHGEALALIGDAAHPTLPFLAQGANLALEDAWVLADCVDHAPVDLALPRYQAARRARVQRAISAANRNARNYHLSGMMRRAGQGALRAMSATAPGLFLKRMDWLYAHDVTRRS